MIDQNTDFFSYVDNFAKINGVNSIKVFGSVDNTANYTIAIPTYKRTEFLKEAIESAISQETSIPYNIIVVDNNPDREDETEKMMLSYKGVKNLSYYKNADNLGMAGNWNRLFQLAQTEWVIMLHDDDVLYPFYLSECDAVLKELDNVGVIKPKEDKNNNPYKKERGKITKLTDVDFYYGNTCGTPSGMLFNRKKVLESGGYNQDFYPSLDYFFHARFASLYDFFFYDTPLMYYRIAVNESVKPSVQKKWLVDASYLIRQILIKNGVPKSVVERFISYRTKRSYKLLKQTFHTEFDIDYLGAGLSKTSAIGGWLAHLYIKLFFFLKKHRV